MIQLAAHCRVRLIVRGAAIGEEAQLAWPTAVITEWRSFALDRVGFEPGAVGATHDCHPLPRSEVGRVKEVRVDRDRVHPVQARAVYGHSVDLALNYRPVHRAFYIAGAIRRLGVE